MRHSCVVAIILVTGIIVLAACGATPTTSSTNVLVQPSAGPMLAVGETWTQNDIALTLQKATIGTDKISALFVLENKTKGQILFTFGLDSFSVKDNTGATGNVWVNNRCIPQQSVCSPGSGDSSLAAGESLQIDMEFSDMSLAKSQVMEVVITVKEISRLKNISWRVSIPH
jgi:hypothetical protein